MSKYNITKEELYELFITKNMTRAAVAAYYGCSEVNIKKCCEKFGIKKPFHLECKNKERKVLKECLNCGNFFEVVKFRAADKWELKFCSHSCSTKYRYLGEEHKKAMRNAVAARRRAMLLNQSPLLTEDEEIRLREFYLNRPPGYEVDHIIPLAKGGLHHPDNLQYLTVSENRRKWCK